MTARPRSFSALILAIIILSLAAIAQDKPTDTLPAVLLNELHVKRVKVGRIVRAKTTSRVVLKNGRVLETGTRLIGRVTIVSPKKDGTPSQLGLLFDRVQVEKNEEIPIAAALVAVGPPEARKGISTIAGNTGMNSWGRLENDGGTFSGNQPKGGPGATPDSPEALQPGVCSLDDINLGKMAASGSGTVLESSKTQVYLDYGTRLLFRIQ